MGFTNYHFFDCIGWLWRNHQPNLKKMFITCNRAYCINCIADVSNDRAQLIVAFKFPQISHGTPSNAVQVGALQCVNRIQWLLRIYRNVKSKTHTAKKINRKRWKGLLMCSRKNTSCQINGILHHAFDKYHHHHRKLTFFQTIFE